MSMFTGKPQQSWAVVLLAGIWGIHFLRTGGWSNLYGAMTGNLVISTTTVTDPNEKEDAGTIDHLAGNAAGTTKDPNSSTSGDHRANQNGGVL